MRPLAFLITLLLVPVLLFSQKHKPTEAESRKYRIQDMIFLSVGYITFSETFISPTILVLDPPLGTFCEEEKVSASAITLIGVVIDIKYNLFDIRDYFSVSVNSPIVLGGSYFVNKSVIGFGHIAVPLMLDLNFFNHSTYNNINDFGFHVGIGRQRMMGPLFGSDDTNPAPDSWTDTVFRMGLKFPYKGLNSYLNVTYGWGGTSRYSRCDDKKVFLPGSEYFRLSFGTIIGY